ncbi:hypothetical protein [uncultured Sphingobacterium sp.]|uniref:hypothetical protein n=1 Tax=uncultured Sphingobacterium sp. TaxID=182688 RepID=UPI0025D75577|nr:hypothetical protein [uncultured Sphingobacterium sp.]
MQHPIAQRINFLINHYTKGNVSHFATLLGFNKQTLNRIFNPDLRSNKYPIPSTELILAICELYPEVRSEWLLLGNGDPFSENSIETTVPSQSEDYKALYLDALKEKDVINKKYVALLEKVANT